MSTIQLTPAQHAILAYAIEHTSGKIEWFPDHVKGGARTKVLEGLSKRRLVNQDGTSYTVAPEGYDALGRTPPALPSTHPEPEVETHANEFRYDVVRLRAGVRDPRGVARVEDATKSVPKAGSDVAEIQQIEKIVLCEPQRNCHCFKQQKQQHRWHVFVKSVWNFRHLFDPLLSYFFSMH